jgi:hypothetical protein
MIRAILVAAALVAIACDDCTPGAFRCAGDRLEICSGDGRQWKQHTDCGDIWAPQGDEPWVCCETSDAGEDECLPAAECP